MGGGRVLPVPDDIFLEPVWFNCTDPKSECTRSEWNFGGAAGVCDALSGFCACPDGFTGEDDLAYYNQCHVKVNLRTTFHALSFTFAFVAMLGVSIGLGRMIYLWGFIVFPQKFEKDGETFVTAAATKTPKNAKDERNSDMSDLSLRKKSSSGGVLGKKSSSSLLVRKKSSRDPTKIMDALSPFSRSELTTGGSRTVRRVLESRKRKRILLLTFLQLFFFQLAEVVYIGMFFLGYSRVHRHWLQNVALAFCVSCLWMAVWLLLFAWYSSLDFPLYGRMFKLRTVLIDYPYFIWHLTVAHIVTVWVYCITTLFAIPLWGNPLQREKAIGALFWFFGLMVLDWIAWLSVIANLLHRSFTKILSTLEKMNSEVGNAGDRAKRTLKHAEVAITRAKQNIVVLVIIVWVLTPFTIALVLVTTGRLRQNSYVFLNVIMILGSVVTMITSYFVAFEDMYGLRQRRGRAHTPQTSATTTPMMES